MSIKHLPLSAYPCFQAHSIDRLCESVERELGATIVEVAKSTAPIAASANRYALPSSDLWFCSYGLPIRLRFSETDDLRIQFQRTGVGATRVGQNLIPVTAGQTCIASAKADVDFGTDYQQVAWRLPRATLKRKLAALTGQPVTHRLDFDHVLDMTTPQSGALRQILNSLLYNIDLIPPNSAKLVLPELENALAVSFLCTAQHNYRDLLDRPAPIAAPWQVYMTESYIEANWNEPLTLENIVAATGASARSIFRAFKKSRGYTPFQFAKQLRLQHAQRLLDCADPVLTVTEVAVACGFENLSQFSKDFSLAFGEPPSAVLNRRRLARS